MVAGPAGIACGTVKVAVSDVGSRVTRAVCVLPAAAIVTSPNSISAACSVIDVDAALSSTWIVSRPLNVFWVRSGANQSV